MQPIDFSSSEHACTVLEASPARSVTSRLFRILLQVAVVAGLWFALLASVDMPTLYHALGQSDLLPLPFGVLVMVGCIAARSMRLWLLFGRPPGMKAVFYAQNLCGMVNNLLPFRTGEVVMAIMLRHSLGISGSKALSVIAVDRLIDLLVVLSFFSVSLFWAPGLPDMVSHSALVMAAAVTVVLGGMILAQRYRIASERLCFRTIGLIRSSHRERWIERVTSLLDGLEVLRRPIVLVQAIALSTVVWGLSTASCYLVLAAFWSEPTPLAAVFAVCLAVFGVTLVAVPAGLGVMHASLVLGVSLFGVPNENAVVFSIAYHAMIVVITTVLGVVSLRLSGFSLDGLLKSVRRDRTKL